MGKKKILLNNHVHYTHFLYVKGDTVTWYTVQSCILFLVIVYLSPLQLFIAYPQKIFFIFKGMM